MIGRIALGIFASAGLGLLVACSSAGTGGAPGRGASPTSPSAVAYAACMRAHGVPNFPDPVGNQQVPKADPQQLGVSSSELDVAEQVCVHLIPPTGDTAQQQRETQCAMSSDCSPTVVAQWMSGLRTLAQCLRAHGEPNWPDPMISSQGRNDGLPHFDYDQAGIDHHSAQVLARVDECMSLTGFQGLPLP